MGIAQLVRRRAVMTAAVGVIAGLLVGAGGGFMVARQTDDARARAAVSAEQDAWTQRMTELLSDTDSNQGAGGGDLPALVGTGEQPSARVYWQDPIDGDYDVLAVCDGANSMLVKVVALKAETHDEIQPGKVLGERTVTCGAIARIPISVDHAAGIGLEAASVADGSAPANGVWYESIVGRGWNPSV